MEHVLLTFRNTWLQWEKSADSVQNKLKFKQDAWLSGTCKSKAAQYCRQQILVLRHFAIIATQNKSSFTESTICFFFFLKHSIPHWKLTRLLSHHLCCRPEFQRGFLHYSTAQTTLPLMKLLRQAAYSVTRTGTVTASWT